MRTHRRCERWDAEGRCGDLAEWETESGSWYCAEHVTVALRDEEDSAAHFDRVIADMLGPEVLS